MEISLKEIELLFKLVLEKLKFEEVESISIDEDLYQIIPTESWSIYAKDVEILTGSLYDDIESLQKLLADKNRPTTFVDLDRLSSLLRAISQKMNPPD